MNTLNDQQLNNVSGGGANGNFWQEGAAIYYRVVAGDTLSQIAQRAQVPMNQILALNPAIKNPDLIRVGQVLRIR
jgi:bacteriocin-like protein